MIPRICILSNGEGWHSQELFKRLPETGDYSLL